jgi:hypothetical protein
MSNRCWRIPSRISPLHIHAELMLTTFLGRLFIETSKLLEPEAEFWPHSF